MTIKDNRDYIRVLLYSLPLYIGVIWGIMEKKMETTIMGYIGIIGYMGACQIEVLFGVP